MRDDLSKVDYLEEDGAGCSPCQDCPFGKDYEVKEDCEECEDCPCFDAGFNMGFKQTFIILKIGLKIYDNIDRLLLVKGRLFYDTYYG